MPDVIRVVMGENNNYLFLACDGLFEAMTNDSLAQFLLERLYPKTATKNEDPLKASHADLGQVLEVSGSIFYGTNNLMSSLGPPEQIFPARQ
jgi:hypothetical protein